MTYRVRCLPTHCTFKSAKALLESALDVGEDDSSIAICSLAYSASYGGAKTAIIRARNLSLKLAEPRSQWSVSIPAENNDSDDGRTQSKEIVIDTHFEGLTPLNSLDNRQQHQIKYVLPSPCSWMRLSLQYCRHYRPRWSCISLVQRAQW